MCGIFGVSLMNGCTVINNAAFRKLISRLFEETSMRGRISSGIAVVRPKGMFVLKKDVVASEFVESDSYKNLLDKHVDLSMNAEGVISVFGHCRYPTKGSPSINHNNHPIVSGVIAGVHNGNISNDDELFKHYMEKNTSFDRAGEVDSEILFRLIDHYIMKEGLTTKQALEKLSEKVEGNYACIFTNSSQPYYIWLFRNYNPITIIMYPKVGLLIYASVKTHILDAVLASGLNLGEPVDFNMETNEAIGFNLFTNIHTRFDLKLKKIFIGNS